MDSSYSGTASHSMLLESGSLTDRLTAIHSRLLQSFPALERIACALYEPQTDDLKTFINSTREGRAITAYHYKLGNSVSLSKIKESGQPRVIDSIKDAVVADNTHSKWLLEQGYQSSFTVPLFDTEGFKGLIFFDSLQPGAFTREVQRDLLLYCTLIDLSITAELNAIRAATASAQVARDFAQLRDFETGAHLERMSAYARIIAREIAPLYGISDESIEHIRLFAPLHDIGKIGIPDSILMKPGKLDPEERRIMQTHVDKGTEMVEKIISEFKLGSMSDSSIMRNIVACHHEFLDGSGYPRGLKGDLVPIEARIVTVADIFDALTSRRPYKTNWSVKDALGELTAMAVQGKLDAHCVSALRRSLPEVEAIIVRYPDEDWMSGAA